MQTLRDRWRRSAIRQFFADLEPVDRVTYLVLVALAFAIAFSFEAIAHHPDVLPW